MSLLHDLSALLPSMTPPEQQRFSRFLGRFAAHLPAIDAALASRLPPDDRARFCTWMLKRWAQIDRVDPAERQAYEATVARARDEVRPLETLDGRAYPCRHFGWQGADITLLGYDWFLGIHDVLYNQYELGDVHLKPDDVIIDAGAFIGDTAVLFHHKLGGRCRIHSFELLDENLALLLHNLERNGVRDDQIVVNRFALADRTGDEIRVGRPGVQGATSMFGGPGGDRVQTVTLDDYVELLGLERVDFIKMDIEGAEALALRGAMGTLRRFRPRLAICLYHRWDDAWRLPQLVHETGVDYHFRFKWVQLRNGWEAVLLANPAVPVPLETTAAPAQPEALPLVEA
jgi:FkbM family methyltransferase